MCLGHVRPANKQPPLLLLQLLLQLLRRLLLSLLRLVLLLVWQRDVLLLVQHRLVALQAPQAPGLVVAFQAILELPLARRIVPLHQGGCAPASGVLPQPLSEQRRVVPARRHRRGDEGKRQHYMCHRARRHESCLLGLDSLKNAALQCLNAAIYCTVENAAPRL